MERHPRLGQSHQVFIDQTKVVGTDRAGRIERELRRSDFLVLLLWADSVQSEMVAGPAGPPMIGAARLLDMVFHEELAPSDLRQDQFLHAGPEAGGG